MGTFHQRFNLIVNEELLSKVAEHVGKETKHVTEQDINKAIYEICLGKKE